MREKRRKEDRRETEKEGMRKRRRGRHFKFIAKFRAKA